MKGRKLHMKAMATKARVIKKLTVERSQPEPRIKPLRDTMKSRSYWSGLEAEEIIQRVAAGEQVADEAERLDVLIDPDTAMLWLRRNKHNRKVSNNIVARYAADMEAGHWPYTHQGIAFDRFGELLDGQHRLQAIIQSGCTVPMQVTVNMPPEVKRAIDQGKPRTVADVATLEAQKTIENNISAVASKMKASVERVQPLGTRTEKVEFVLRHLPAILFAMEQLPDRAKRIAYSATRAVIARAYYTVERSELERFCTILREGSYGHGEGVVFMLREFIMRKGCRSAVDALDIYRKTEWVLKRFLAREPADRVRPIETEQFKLPEEQ